MTTENKDNTTDEVVEEKTESPVVEEVATENVAVEEEVQPIVEEKKEEAPVKVAIYPDVLPGATVRIHQKIREMKGKELKERIQIFEGIVLARKHGNESGATITVRKVAKGGFAVEKIYPLHSPIIATIEVVKQAIVKKAKLGFLRTYKKNLKIKKVK